MRTSKLSCDNSFNISRKDQYHIDRPGFSAGQYYPNITADDIPKNIRSGVGNRAIHRENFMAVSPQARNPLIMNELQALAISEINSEIGTTSDNKLGKTTYIFINDKSDFKWIKEETRLRAEILARFINSGRTQAEAEILTDKELNFNLPFGREQKKIRVKSDTISNDARINTKQKLTEISQEVIAGRAESRAQQLILTNQLIAIFADTQQVANLTNIQLTGLGTALGRLGIPVNYKALNIVPRFVDIDSYNQNAGPINLLLYSKVRESPNSAQYNYQNIVPNFSQTQNGLPAVTLRTMLQYMGRQNNRLYLDLETGGLINLRTLRTFANRTTNHWSNPAFDIRPQNR